MKKFKFKGLKLLILISIVAIQLAIIDPSNIYMLWVKFIVVIYKVIPIFALVILLTAVINFFLRPKQIMKHFGKDGGKMGIFYALVGGVLSHGPMYAWYPMLEDMRKHGLRDGLIATFMYARAVKLPLLPFMIALFGLGFAVTVNACILLFAIIQGYIVDSLNTDT